ncbi:MAG: rubredoxin [Deltaproteobacteria bacterium]|nr:rubredoxin [Deltaproteobacteria bacterium]
MIDNRAWQCTVCGYVYDPALGDSAAGVPPETAFGELPPAWVCPICRAGQDYFEILDECA